MSRRITLPRISMIVLIVLIVAVVYVLLSALARTNSETQPTATTSPTGIEETPLLATTTPTATPEAASTGEATTAAPTIQAPTPPDEQDVEEVAQFWLLTYATRSSDSDTTWMDEVEPYTGSELQRMLGDIEDKALADRQPTQATKVEIGDNVSAWGPDTPLRWSHEMTLTFTDAQGQSYLAIYRVGANLTGEGWVVTSAEPTGWYRQEG